MEFVKPEESASNYVDFGRACHDTLADYNSTNNNFVKFGVNGADHDSNSLCKESKP